MSFDKLLLAVESRDLSQAEKSIIRVSFFPKTVLNDKIYPYIYITGNSNYTFSSSFFHIISQK